MQRKWLSLRIRTGTGPLPSVGPTHRGAGQNGARSGRFARPFAQAGDRTICRFAKTTSVVEKSSPEQLDIREGGETVGSGAITEVLE